MSKPFILSFTAGMLLLFSIGKAMAQSTVIDEHFKAINNHDIKAVVATYTSDAQVFSPNWEGAKVGQDSVSNVFSRYFKSTPDLVYKMINTINAGNKITVEYSFSGTLSNPEGGTPDYMKGKKYTLQGCAIFILKGNKIVKETNYFDQVAFLKQVGFFDQNH
jgi:steroid delta-isomerase-like uncharacterized protein